MQTLEEQHYHKKDILFSLPYELSCRILDQLRQETLVHCLNVNSSWRSLVTNYPKIWRYIHIPVFEENPLYLPFYKLLPYVTHHTQELELDNIKGLKKCLDLIRRNNFENLCTIRMRLCKNTENIIILFIYFYIYEFSLLSFHLILKYLLIITQF